MDELYEELNISESIKCDSCGSDMKPMGKCMLICPHCMYEADRQELDE